MSQININDAWGAVSASLKNFSFYKIKEIVGLAGLDPTSIANLVQQTGFQGASKGQLITAIDKGLVKFSVEDKQHFLNIVVEEILKRSPPNDNTEQQLEKYLSRLGWQVIDGAVLPIKILDRKDLEELDDVSKEDLIKSAIRFRDGDLSGALAAACGAVDSITNKIYADKNLGNANSASFQERCTKALESVGVFSAIENQLRDINWDGPGVVPLGKNFKGALNQASYVMQSLRANMSDVHGTKPVLKPLVFDSIKWAQIIIRLLSGQYV